MIRYLFIYLFISVFINEIILVKNTWWGHVHVYSWIWVRAEISFPNPWSASFSCATLQLCRTIFTQGTGGSFVQLKFKMCFTLSRGCRSIQNPSELTIILFLLLLVLEASHFLNEHIFRDRAVSAQWRDLSGQELPAGAPHSHDFCSSLHPSSSLLGRMMLSSRQSRKINIKYAPFYFIYLFAFIFLKWRKQTKPVSCLAVPCEGF